MSHSSKENPQLGVPQLWWEPTQNRMRIAYPDGSVEVDCLGLGDDWLSSAFTAPTQQEAVSGFTKYSLEFVCNL